jgi:hypothetical protein
MKNLLILFFLSFFLLITNAFSNILNKEIEGAKTTVKDTALVTKYIFTNPITVKKRINVALARIENECCEENFQYLNDIKDIQENLQNCLNKKCQNFMLPLYKKDKPPLKVVVLKQIVLLDDLIIENEKQKYENLLNQLEQDKNKLKIENENDINLVKKQFEELKKENIKLKQTVDKMLVNYQDKIKKLKKENERIKENFNYVFEAHSKNKQKKLEKDLK